MVEKLFLKKLKQLQVLTFLDKIEFKIGSSESYILPDYKLYFLGLIFTMANV